jgi:hypothetical protein
MATINYPLRAIWGTDYTGEAANVGVILKNSALIQIGSRETGFTESPAGSGIYEKVQAIDTDDLPISLVGDIAGSDAEYAVGRITAADVAEYQAPAAGSGPFTLEYTVLDEDGEPVEGARVTLRNLDHIFQATTDADGVATLYPAAGTFTETIIKTRVSYTPVSVTVSADAEYEREVAVMAIVPPADPDMATITIALDDFGASADATFVFTSVDKRRLVLNETIQYDNQKSVTTSGRVGTISLPKSSVLEAAGYKPKFQVSSYTIKLNEEITIPDEGGSLGQLIREAQGLT